MAEIYETEREVKIMTTTNFIVRLESDVKNKLKPYMVNLESI